MTTKSKKSKRTYLTYEDKLFLHKFWNSIEQAPRMKILGAFTSIVYICQKDRLFTAPTTDKLFKWLKRVIIEHSGRTLEVGHIELTKLYFKQIYSIDIDLKLFPTKEFIEEVINDNADTLYDPITRGGKFKELWV